MAASNVQCQRTPETHNGHIATEDTLEKVSAADGRDLEEQRARIVFRRQVRGPGAIPRLCEECGTMTAHGKEGDSEEFLKKWFCMNCWDSWERGYSEGAKESLAHDEVGANRHPPRSLLIQMWFAREDALMVSLGTWCGVKKGMQGINFGSPSLPFDWIRVSIQGVIRLLRTGFDGFFDYHYITEDRHFLAESHSFFHDDVMSPLTVERYKRRIDRFWKLRERGCQSKPLPTIFVYALNSSVELCFVAELRTLLCELFGTSASLLVLFDGQPDNHTIFFRDLPGLMLCTIGKSFARKEEYDIIDPPYVRAYHAPFTAALSFVNDCVCPAASRLVHSVDELVQDALNGEKHCLIEHICLGEDLSTSMAYEPHLPSDETFRKAHAPKFKDMNEIVWAQCKAHYRYIGGMNVVEDAEGCADERLSVCRWRIGFVAAMFGEKVLCSQMMSVSREAQSPRQEQHKQSLFPRGARCEILD